MALACAQCFALGRGRGLAVAALACAEMLISGAQAAAQTAAASNLQAEQNRLVEVATELRRQGKIREADFEAQKALDLIRKLRGADHPDVLNTLEWIADMHEDAGDWARAIPVWAEALAWREQHQPPGHFLTVDRRVALTSLRRLAELTATERADVVQSHADNANVVTLANQGRYDEAIALAENVLAVRERVLGIEEPLSLQALGNLASLYGKLGSLDRAVELALRAVEVNRRVFGPMHPQYAVALNTLAAQHYRAGNLAAAEPYYVESARIERETSGDATAAYAEVINNLSVLYANQNDFLRAEPLARRAVEIRKKLLGEDSLEYATSINNLAVLHRDMGDFARAEALFLEHLAIISKVADKTHPSYAVGLNNLAAMYHGMRDYARAEPLYVEASQVLAARLGKRHPHYASSLGNLAALYRAMGRFERAEPLFTESLAIARELFGEAHPQYAQGLSNLGLLYQDMHRLDDAERSFRRALELKEQTLGRDHAEYAITLSCLAGLLRQRGRYAEAVPLVREALQIVMSNADAGASIQDQQGQLAQRETVELYLGRYLSCLVDRPDAAAAAAEAYQVVLSWKGATLVRQRAARLAADSAELGPLFAELQSVVTQWSTLVGSPARENPRWRARVEQLAARRRAIEVELSSRSAAFRAAVAKTSLPELTAAIPPDAALIDYVEFVRDEPLPDHSATLHYPALVAFVIRPGSAVQMIPLGSSAAVSELIDAWRADFGQSPSSRAAGAQLRASLWQPLAAAVGDAKLALVSPDGALGCLAFPALPGAKPNSYLIEDLAIALVPVPQLIPTLVAETAPADLPKDLLVVGGVNYDSRNGASAPAAGAPATSSAPVRPWERRFPGQPTHRSRQAHDPWQFLRGADSEAAFIRELYRDAMKLPPESDRIASLRDAEATEEAVRRLAPQAYMMHLATHGFFDLGAQPQTTPPVAGVEAAPAVVAIDQGQSSGLVLAGANRPPEIPADPTQLDRLPDDGYLNAAEIAALPLGSAQLVVLSACESGLGAAAGGEGLLGVQRAFQLAGARTTIATLWKVNDEATRRIMEEFYRNYLVEKQSPLEALRSAQLWALENPELIPRGVDPPPASGAQVRLSPKLWAAFTVSGDWR